MTVELYVIPGGIKESYCNVDLKRFKLKVKRGVFMFSVFGRTFRKVKG